MLHAQTLTTDTIYCVPSHVDHVPLFQDGTNGIAKFFATRLRFPGKGMVKNIQGQVVASIVVNKSGKVANTKIIKEVYYAYNEEVLCFINLQPKWLPAVKNRKTVSCRYYLPVSFVINND